MSRNHVLERSALPCPGSGRFSLRMLSRSSRLPDARKLFAQVVIADEFPEFLTLVASDLIE